MSESVYDAINLDSGPHDELISSRGRTDRTARLLSLLRPGMTVLDAGCGSGTFLFSALCRLESRGRFFGLDRRVESLREGHREKTAARAGCAAFLAGDVRCLPFQDGVFDLVYCRHLLMHLSESGRAIGEMVRLVRSGGSLVIMEGDFNSHRYAPRYPGWERYMAFVGATLAPPMDGAFLEHWARRHELADIYVHETVSTMTGEAFKNQVESWLRALEGYADLLIGNGVSDRKSIQAILREGRKLRAEEDGSFTCTEYELVGTKR